jgi:transcriptional regulator with XRE-family HTH domain
MVSGSLAERLRVLRAQRGMTLIEAAEQAGVGRDTLSDLERGRRHPVMPTLAKIAQGYGVPVEDLLEEPVPLDEASDSETGPSDVEWQRPSLDQVRETFAPRADGLNHYCARWEEKLSNLQLQGTREEVVDFFLDLEDFDASFSAVYEDELRAIALALDLGNRYGESGLPRDMAVGFIRAETEEHSLMRRALKRCYAVGHALAQSIGDDERAETMQRMEQAFA